MLVQRLSRFVEISLALVFLPQNLIVLLLAHVLSPVLTKYNEHYDYLLLMLLSLTWELKLFPNPIFIIFFFFVILQVSNLDFTYFLLYRCTYTRKMACTLDYPPIIVLSTNERVTFKTLCFVRFLNNLSHAVM